jgi:hypothetical protein
MRRKQMLIKRFFCSCIIEEFYLPADKLEDEDEILCPYCGDEPINYDLIIMQKENNNGRNNG